MDGLTHLDEQGKARMVDVSAKSESVREAEARGEIWMDSATFDLIRDGGIKKGDVLAVARIAGIMATKRTSDLIPLCHPIKITSASVDFCLDAERSVIEAIATVRATDITGVEMEALTACSVALLAIYDMAKAVDRAMVIENVRLMRKVGGKSGDWEREET